ncbi:MAG: hypothetical protein K2R98_27050 [Gemmataceae bacterium]|nr:hypothetical protein [Gemmataceae bacterium]
MEATVPATDLERRKQVRLRLRPDLDIAPHRYEGRTYYIVKDPVSLRYYRFKEQEHFLIRLMDGTHTLDDAQKHFERRFRPERLTLEDLEGFAQQLLTVGLAHNESPQAGKQLFDRRKKRLRREWLATLTNILYIKIPIFDPDKLLIRMLNKGLFPSFMRLPIFIVFAVWTALCIGGSILSPFVMAADQLGLFGASTPPWVQLFAVGNVFPMWVAWIALYFLYRLSKDLRFIFTSWFFALSVGVMLAAVGLVLTHFGKFRDMLPNYHQFFSMGTVLNLWIALGVVKVIHEFGHGLSCKAFGGEVHEMGALFLCLSPCLYCNVSDAWTMPNKWQRIIISFAGIYVELIIAAIATFIWWNTPSHPFVNNLSLSLMVVCSVSTVVFNGNPLMRYDGYYILADWLEIPNLRDRCNRYLQKLVMEHCLGIEVPREQYMALWRRWLFVVYAVISYVYRWVVTFSILFFLYKFLEPYKLGAISALMAIAAAASMVGWPLWRLLSNLNKRGRFPDMKQWRVAVSVSVLVLIAIGFFVIPLPVSRIRQTGVVQFQPEAVEKLYVPNPGGILEKLYVRNGDFVQENQELARFQNQELENQLGEARTQHELAGVKVKSFQDQANRSTDPIEKSRLDGDKVKAESDREFYQQKVSTIDKLIKELVLKAPRSGIILGAPKVDEEGKYWDKDQEMPFCSIGEPGRLRVLVPVVPSDYRLMKDDLAHGPDLAVTVRIHGRDSGTWQGKISQLPESEAKEVPGALTNKHGGPLAIKPTANPNAFVPQSQQYLVGIDLMNPDAAMCAGTIAQVKVHCRWRTGAWWVWRTISSTFDLGLI